VIRHIESAIRYFQSVSISPLTRADPGPDNITLNDSLFSAQKFSGGLRFLSDRATEGGS